MPSLGFLVTDLQTLSSETRRKHPDVREAAEKSLTILRTSSDQASTSLTSDGPQVQEILRPVFMGCATKNAKVVGIALGSLQRLIALRAVSSSVVPTIVTTMAECASGGVDIQLRILQTILSLVTNFPQLHGAMLGSALLLCFKLHESRTAVVSSTAAATLRQLVMFVVDKVVEEDKRLDTAPPSLLDVNLPDGTSVSLRPCARDAYAVFEDLCLLANSERPNYLKLDALPKTFALELIESVVTNHHEVFRTHRELLMLLRHHLSPLLLKSMSDRTTFPLMLRSTRVIFLLLKQFCGELDAEAEVFFVLLVKIIGAEPESTSSGESYTRPIWTRVLAMEIMRGLCSDAELMRRVWERFDAHPDGSSVFTQLVTALKRLVTEKPVVLGASQQMLGVGVPGGSDSFGPAAGMAGMVANAASATVTNVVGIISSGPGLSAQHSAMKLQCIDQLDKADAPPIPDSYAYLLGVQCLVSLSDGFATFAAPIYTALVKQRPRAAGDPAIRAPPALDIASLPAGDPNTRALTTVRSMVENAWPAFLAAFSFVISANLSDDLFVDVLASYQALTNVAGMLNLPTPRDAFLASLAKYAIPTRVVSGVDAYLEPPTPRTASSLTENLGLSGPSGPPGLSERNMACLKILISSAIFLSGSLDSSWFSLLEAIQNAEYVLTLKGTRGRATGGLSAPPAIHKRASMSSAQLGSSQPPAVRHPMLSDLDPENVMAAVQRLFDASKNMDDSAFQHFVAALCKLSSAMVGMQSAPSPSPIASAHASREDLTIVSHPSTLGDISLMQRRRVSGIHLQHAPRSGDFAINKLGGVALQNMHRLVYRSPEVAWDTVIQHLLSVAATPMIPQGIRIQAAKVLDEILLVVPRNIAKDSKEDVQKRVIDALSKQIIADPVWNEASPTRVEVTRMGLEALHEILQLFGHTLLVGWESIFDMLASVCTTITTRLDIDLSQSAAPSAPSSPVKSKRPLALGLASERSYAALVKIAFNSLKLVCDSLSILSLDQLRLCISTIGKFGRQPDTNIALTAAESILWSVSDSIQAKRKESPEEQEWDGIWMFLLLEVLGLCTDGRSAVRVGAIQTLFRTLQLYGATLTLQTWDDCIWKVTFPLLDSISASSRQASIIPMSPAENPETQDRAWNDSKILALQSTGAMFSQFLASKIIRLESFEKAWDVFVSSIQDTVLTDSRPVSGPALRCLDVMLQATQDVTESDLEQRRIHISERAWECFRVVGSTVVAEASSATTERKDTQPYSQDSLVALVDVLRSTRRITDGGEWTIEKLTRMTTILKGICTYTESFDFRPDADTPSPLQSDVFDAITGIKRTVPDIGSLVLRDLAGYVTLPFLAAFDAPQVMYVRSGETQAKPSSSGRKRVTYIGLAKKVMPLIVSIYNEHQQQELIYEDGTLETIFAAYSIPIKLKYDCPASSKFGPKEPSLWKTASTSFLRIIEKAVPHVMRLQSTLSPDNFATIWRQTMDVYRGGILSDCSACEQLDPSSREEDEAFDRAWLASLQADVIPHLGDPQVTPSILEYLARILQEGSRLHEFSVAHPANDGPVNNGAKPDRLDLGERRAFDVPTTQGGTLLPREAFSYWCFDLLFQLCSSSVSLPEETSRRIAAFAIPALLARCRTMLVAFIADGSLRGSLPFSRTREEEVLYILRKLLDLRLWPGSLWAALSASPSEYCVQQPSPSTDMSPSQLIADAARRSTKAHLFQLYPMLCEIASSSRTAIAWMSVAEGGDVEELEARNLAAQCLIELGKEMGMQQ